MSRPTETEYAPYYSGYISLVPDGDIVATLGTQMIETQNFFLAIPQTRETFRYAPEKWSFRQVLGHLIDAERVFGFRAFTFSRAEGAALPGFDESSYVAGGGYADTPLPQLVSEYEHLRRSNILMYRSLPAGAWMRHGIANEKEVSVRALAWITAGHERHHWSVLRSKYSF